MKNFKKDDSDDQTGRNIFSIMNLVSKENQMFSKRDESFKLA